MRSALLSAVAAGLLAGCGEPIRDDHYANRTEASPQPQAAQVAHVVPVRIGELGANFDACATAGTTRHLEAGKQLPVRAAPFDSAAETGAVAAGRRFFVCTRSHDQKWLGIVYDSSGTLAESCGVSSPVSSRRAYGGPCRSGWVSSPFVRLVAGAAEPPVAAGPPPAEAPEGEAGGTKGG